MASLELVNLTKRYPGAVSVDAIDLAVRHGEFVCLLGPSARGKTTTLRMIAGFLAPNEGEIRVGGKTMPRAVVPPERRNMSMIFQSYAVWPHMRVRDNTRGTAAQALDLHPDRRSEAIQIERAEVFFDKMTTIIEVELDDGRKVRGRPTSARAAPPTR